MIEKFKVGDKVKGLGMEGEVIPTLVVNKLIGYPIRVRFLNQLEHCFTEDGRFFDNGEPCLELLERPKQKVKRTFYKAYWTDFDGNVIYESSYVKSVEEVSKPQFPNYNKVISIEEKEFEIEE
jgi:hypothetical protein